MVSVLWTRKLSAQLPDTVSLDLPHLQDAYSNCGPQTIIGELVCWSAWHDETPAGG
jgi:hypothetical protein